MSLQIADEDEQERDAPGKKKKKGKGSELGGENDVEQWVLKRQKLRAKKVEEVIKSKRTVFVGNLPIGCTKKVQREQKVLNKACFHSFKMSHSHSHNTRKKLISLDNL